MMLEAGLIASRFLHYLAVLSLFGAALYPLYTFRGRLDVLAIEQAKLVRSLRRLLFLTVALTLVSGLSWFVFTTASMADDMTQVASPAMLRTMMEATDFGPLWAARLALTVLIGVLLLRWPRKSPLLLVPLLAALLLLSLAGTGHTRITEGWGGTVHIASDAAHLLAAGLWLGGLWPLGIVIAMREQPNTRRTVEILHRFSGVATIAVALLVASGLVNSWFLVGSVETLFASDYNRLLLLKLALFAAMTFLAINNRFVIMPRLEAGIIDTGALLARLRTHVVMEQGLGIAVLTVVSALGLLQPGTG